MSTRAPVRKRRKIVLSDRGHGGKMRSMTKPKRIGFLLFDGITALDLTGPAEAFACARLPGARGAPRPAYDVVTIGLSRRACVAESGVTLVPATTIAAAPALDTLIVPGGNGLRRASDQPQSGRVDRARARRGFGASRRFARASMASRPRGCSTAAESRRTGTLRPTSPRNSRSSTSRRTSCS